MQYAVKSASATKTRSQCLIVPVSSNKLSGSAAELDKACGGVISQRIKAGDFDGKSGHSLMLYGLDGIAAERLLLIGTGKAPVSPANFRKAVSLAVTKAKKSGAGEAVCFLPEVAVENEDAAWAISQATLGTENALYQYDSTKSKKADKIKLKKITWCTTETVKGAKAVLDQAVAMATGMNLARELGNLPGNVCTPTYLANEAKSMARSYTKLKTKVLEEADMRKLGMGALLSVSRGSRQPAKLIIMEYKGGKATDKPIVLVGKGLTFDSGGISIKPAPSMDEMKYDMCGGASVFGTMKALCEMDAKANVIGVVPSSENMPDGDANKPGDVVTSMSGQTIEVLNTDAEGRLILCDALTYVERYKPAAVVDIATLTGACVIALGSHASGLFSQNDKLAGELLAAGEQTGDRAWRMPLWEDYQDQLKSNFADMANVGGREAGSVTAACFLARYTKKYDWAHLDIAGTAWTSGGHKKGASGRPVPLLSQFVVNRIHKKK